MTPEGKKLFKKAFAGLGIFLVLVFGANLFTKGSKKTSDDNADNLTPTTSPALTDSLALSEEDSGFLVPSEVRFENHSAVKGLVKLLNFQAHNHFRSQRLKNAIYLWNTTLLLEPEFKIGKLKLDQARAILDYQIQLSLAIAKQDVEALRYKRAIQNYQRAANFAEGVDPQRHADSLSKIRQLESRLAQ